MTLPTFLYGTAWKEDRTEALVQSALEAGFRGIDTANQRRHYDEAAVGRAIRGWERSTLFLQTKFTHVAGQDHRLPYDRNAPPDVQVMQSFESSLEHLGVETIDSYVLHGPMRRDGLTKGDLLVWRAMEALEHEGRTRWLGVSNVSLQQLAALVHLAEVKPAFVQNRCYARTAWDGQVRAFCRRHDMVYQAFSLLTANGPALHSEPVTAAARRTGATREEVVFRFALDVGMLPLTGTTDPEHMRRDLACVDLRLEPEENRAIETVGVAQATR